MVAVPGVRFLPNAITVLALCAGLTSVATDLLLWTRAHRQTDGSYLTGLVYPDVISFPDQECSAYTAAAVILAADVLSRASAASGLFLGEHLPPVVDEAAEIPR